MKLVAAITISLAVAATAAAKDPAAADLTGVWIGEIPSPGDNRPPTQMAFEFRQSGSEIGGKQYGDFRDVDSAPLIEGKIEGEQVRFAVERREQAGNLIHIVRYHYVGTYDDNEIELTREKARAWDAVNGAPAAVRRPDDTDEEDRERRFKTFRLERLY